MAVAGAWASEVCGEVAEIGESVLIVFIGRSVTNFFISLIFRLSAYL